MEIARTLDIVYGPHKGDKARVSLPSWCKGVRGLSLQDNGDGYFLLLRSIRGGGCTVEGTVSLARARTVG